MEEDTVASELASMEAEYERLAAVVDELKQGHVPEELASPELMQLQTENAKLKYQANMLKRSIAAEQQRACSGAGSGCGDFSVGLGCALRDIFSAALHAAYPGLGDITVSLTLCSNPKFGDYQCNAAMSVAKALNKSGVKTNPREVAQKTIENLPVTDMIGKSDVTGPGFINITLKPEFVASKISELVTLGVRPPRVPERKRVVVDMSSPNIAKEMHVGHLRSTIIGDCVANLCSFVGHDVLKLNHVGDWGTQFGMLIAHLVDQFPDYQRVSPPISDLQAFYKESKVRFEKDEEFKKRAYSYVVRLQRREPDVTQAWNLICDASRKEFAKVYERLNIRNLVERGESFYQDMMDDLAAELDRKGMLELDEGRKVMFADGCKVPLTVVKSDGGYTYDTSDMAALRHRLTAERADWVFYVVDIGQGLHFDTVFRAAERAEIMKPGKHRIAHISFGVVLGDDGKKFRTRSGDTVRLVDLLDEGVQRSEAKLREKGRDKVLSGEEFAGARDSVAYSCIKYADLSHNRVNDYHFSFDRMLDDTGNTAVYLLYAYMRIKSIARAAGVSADQLRAAAAAGPLPLTEPAEWKLAKYTLRFPDLVLKLLDDLLLHSLCEYLYEMSQTFTEFYSTCYCIEKEKTGEKRIHMHRLVLCEAVAAVMREGFNILGIQPVSRM